MAAARPKAGGFSPGMFQIVIPVKTGIQWRLDSRSWSGMTNEKPQNQKKKKKEKTKAKV